MPSEKRLKSVCNSIAQHAVSSLSFIHPHLSQACRSHGIHSISLDLISSDPCPDQFKPNEPVHLSLISLHNRFKEILTSEGFGIADIEDTILVFEFPNEYLKFEDYCTNCHVHLTSKKGNEFVYSVDCFGHPLYPKRIRKFLLDNRRYPGKLK